MSGQGCSYAAPCDEPVRYDLETTDGNCWPLCVEHTAASRAEMPRYVAAVRDLPDAARVGAARSGSAPGKPE